MHLPASFPPGFVTAIYPSSILAGWGSPLGSAFANTCSMNEYKEVLGERSQYRGTQDL